MCLCMSACHVRSVLNLCITLVQEAFLHARSGIQVLQEIEKGLLPTSGDPDQRGDDVMIYILYLMGMLYGIISI